LAAILTHSTEVGAVPADMMACVASALTLTELTVKRAKVGEATRSSERPRAHRHGCPSLRVVRVVMAGTSSHSPRMLREHF